MKNGLICPCRRSCPHHAFEEKEEEVLDRPPHLQSRDREGVSSPYELKLYHDKLWMYFWMLMEQYIQFTFASCFSNNTRCQETQTLSSSAIVVDVVKGDGPSTWPCDWLMRLLSLQKFGKITPKNIKRVIFHSSLSTFCVKISCLQYLLCNKTHVFWGGEAGERVVFEHPIDKTFSHERNVTGRTRSFSGTEV